MMNIEQKKLGAIARAQAVLASSKAIEKRQPFDHKEWSSRQPDPDNVSAWRAWMAELPPAPPPAPAPVDSDAHLTDRELGARLSAEGRDMRARERQQARTALQISDAMKLGAYVRKVVEAEPDVKKKR